MVPAGFRVGFGEDAHRLVIGRKLILGGVSIPYSLGLEGHSDADVVSHAVGDAILGALSAGDLGKHFPDTDPKYKGTSSLKLLQKIARIAEREGAEIQNVDATIIAEDPKLGPHVDRMRRNVAEALGVRIDAVSIKATTTEGMGPFGRGEGIAARAVALVKFAGDS